MRLETCSQQDFGRGMRHTCFSFRHFGAWCTISLNQQRSRCFSALSRLPSVSSDERRTAMHWMKHRWLLIMSLLLVVLASCSSPAASTPQPTATPTIDSAHLTAFAQFHPPTLLFLLPHLRRHRSLFQLHHV